MVTQAEANARFNALLELDLQELEDRKSQINAQGITLNNADFRSFPNPVAASQMFNDLQAITDRINKLKKEEALAMQNPEFSTDPKIQQEGGNDDLLKIILIGGAAGLLFL